MTVNEMYNKVDALKAQLEKLKPLKPSDDERLWKKFRLEWNYNSNHIEGNTLTYSQTELLLIFGKTTGDQDKREYDEMEAHDVAIKLIVELTSDIERGLTENFIRQLNEIILVKPFWKEAITPNGQPTQREIIPGEYKQYPNSVILQNGERFDYATPEETPAKMSDLMRFYNENAASTDVHPLWLASLLHYKFVLIHPFDDGNGRIARLLMNYVLIKNGFPPVIIKDAEKKKYLNALNKADTGDLESFVNYIGDELIWSLEKSILAAEGKSIDDVDDLDKELSLLKRELKGENVLDTKVSVDIICNTIEENIIPIFILIEEKCEGLKESFFVFNRRVQAENYKEHSPFVIGTNETTWEQLTSNWLATQIRKDKVRLKSIRYNYELRGFKKTVQGNSFWLHLEVHFDDYNYIIQTNINQSKPLQLPYGKKLNTVDVHSIITPMLKDLIENIKRLNGSGK